VLEHLSEHQYVEKQLKYYGGRLRRLELRMDRVVEILEAILLKSFGVKAEIFREDWEEKDYDL